MEGPDGANYRTSVEQKRHAKEVAKMHRSGHANARDLLRERCRLRITNARKNNVDANRNLQLSDLENILRAELDEVDLNVKLEQHVFDELLTDVNEWYAMQVQHVETLYTEPNAVPTDFDLLCPICLVKPLQRLNTKYSCICGAQFDHAADKKQLQELLQQKVNEHELKCTQALGFFLEKLPQSNTLFAICGNCDYCCSV